MAHNAIPFEYASFFWTLVGTFNENYKSKGIPCVNLGLDFDTRIDTAVTLRCAMFGPAFADYFRAAQVFIHNTTGYYLVDTTDYSRPRPHLFLNAYSRPYRSRNPRAHHLQFNRAPTQAETTSAMSLIAAIFATPEDAYCISDEIDVHVAEWDAECDEEALNHARMQDADNIDEEDDDDDIEAEFQSMQ